MPRSRGFSDERQDELGLLLQAGPSALEAIQLATANAAVVCGQGDELGSLEVGKLADLIVEHRGGSK